jgi:hypothetical protein
VEVINGVDTYRATRRRVAPASFRGWCGG